MAYNLIEEKWIPVLRKDGTRVHIAPWEITDRLQENPIQQLDALRHDFNGSLVQILIGLAQTTISVSSDKEWKKMLLNPPSPDQLHSFFRKAASAFNLNGDSGRFMQDFDNDLSGAEVTIDSLLPDTPGEKTIAENADIFIKRGMVENICLPCCAVALFSNQAYASSGGVGYRTSLRGGGPLTTVIQGNTLWETIWLNVLTEEDFEPLGNPEKYDFPDIFPWMAPTRSSINGETTLPEDCSAKQMFWGMPRRLRLDTDLVKKGTCDLCGDSGVRVIQKCTRLNYGTNYAGDWQHVLTPYYEKKDGKKYPVHVHPEGIGYQHWMGIVQGNGENQYPALVVSRFLERLPELDLTGVSQNVASIWCFGYSFDKAKVHGWYESRMPIVMVSPELRSQYELTVSQLIQVSDIVAWNTKSCLKGALFPEFATVKGNIEGVMTSQFWKMSEAKFYQTLQDLKNALEAGEDVDQIKIDWCNSLGKISLDIFDTYSQSEFLGMTASKRVVMSRLQLRNFNSIKGKKIRKTLDLPELEKPEKPEKAKKPKAAENVSEPAKKKRSRKSKKNTDPAPAQPESDPAPAQQEPESSSITAEGKVGEI